MMKAKNVLNENMIATPPPPTFLDVFSGCGGLSLGLFSAGWQGVFAIEKNPAAFVTLEHNLCSSNPEKFKFSWPAWLPKKPMAVSELLSGYREHLLCLKGVIDLIAGGPPCQGFSSAGKRNPDDPRNALVKEYIEVVEIIKPRLLLIENVKGFTAAFKAKKKSDVYNQAYSEFVRRKLENLGYVVFSSMICCSEFGVPQYRKRFIMLCIKNNDPLLEALGDRNPISLLMASAQDFRISKGIGAGINISVKNAISDLELNKNEIISHKGPQKGFMQISYKEASVLSKYQTLMRYGSRGKSPNSLRLARHTEPVISRFKKIQTIASLGKCLTKEDRKRFNIKKHSITPLHPHLPSATVTTLPDDILHYSEPRILTVRENARLQSFPDWFEFKGNYTTGGKSRTKDCPRYTQVGNAVPPLLSEAIGRLLLKLINSSTTNNMLKMENHESLKFKTICVVGA